MNFNTFKEQNLVPTSVILAELLTGIFFRESGNTWQYFFDEYDFKEGTCLTAQDWDEGFDDFVLRTTYKVINEEEIQKDSDFWKETSINYAILQSKW